MIYVTRRRNTKLIAYPVLGLLMLFSMFPTFWMILTSLKTEGQIRRVSQSPFWPTPFTLDVYRTLLAERPFGQWLMNSLTVSIGSTILAVTIGALGAYALTRMRFTGRATFGSLILITYLVPPTVLFIPLFQMIKGLGLSNSLVSLIVAYPTFTVPYVTWMLMSFFETIPIELEEAARVDGASRLQAFRMVILPIALPGLVATALFAFTQAWNEFLYALTFISSAENITLQVGISRMITGDVFIWGQLMAASTLATIPVILIFLFLQKYNIAGLTAGSVKG